MDMWCEVYKLCDSNRQVDQHVFTAKLLESEKEEFQAAAVAGSTFPLYTHPHSSFKKQIIKKPRWFCHVSWELQSCYRAHFHRRRASRVRIPQLERREEAEGWSEGGGEERGLSEGEKERGRTLFSSLWFGGSDSLRRMREPAASPGTENVIVWGRSCSED